MSRRVNGHGPVPCPIVLIGQRPGKVEAYRGKPFVGPSGEMLNDYLLSAGIDRANCYVTNVVKYFDGEDDVTDAEVQEGLPELRRELTLCRPKYIGLLGKVAVSALLPSVADFDMYWGHGLMFCQQMPWGYCRLMPLYHPAAGMHQTSIQGATSWDFEQFSRMVRGETVQPYRECNRTGTYTEALTLPHGDCAIDTEGSVRRPWCLSWSGAAGRAYVVRWHGVRHIVDKVTLWHSLHDLRVLKAMGITVASFDDAMLKASLLGVEPYGLKDSARRHLGLRMQSYSELTADAQKEKSVNWLGEALLWLNSHYPDESVTSLKPAIHKKGGRKSERTSTVTAS